MPYEVTFYTGDVAEAGTDSQVFIKVFGVKGSSSDIYIDKLSERFERGKVDLIKVTDRSYMSVTNLCESVLLKKIRNGEVCQTEQCLAK